MDEYYFEDVTVGDRFEFGGKTVTKAEIIDFAVKYDPQYFHIDEDAAKDSIFGGLCASGWHTVCICGRLMVDDIFSRMAIMGGRGVEDLRWSRPVRPGDTLSGWIEITDKDVSETRPERGYMDFKKVAVNQNDEEILSYINHAIIERRG